jgi:ATP-dependent helicase IRC3
MFKLRPYQSEALRISKEKYEAGVTRQLISAATGLGKTVMFSSVPKHHQIKGKTLILVHREELAQQAADKFKKWNPDLRVGIEMGDNVSSPDDDVIVAGVQSIGRDGSDRINKFKPNDFGCVITDEAHRSAAESYLSIYDYFGLRKPDNKKLCLGVTATPARSDGQGLGLVYDEIVYNISILDAIKQGWLVDVRGYRVNTTTSLESVHTRTGDFARNELEEAVNNSERNHLVVQSWLKHAPDRTTAVFAVDVAHTKELAKTFRAYGVDAEGVWGGDPARADKIKRLRNGKLKVIVNCELLIEGFDCWQIDAIVLARPTKSALLFTQQIGRGTRLPEGVDNLLDWRRQGKALSKEDCILIDVVDNTSRHSLVTLASLFGIGPKIDLNGASVVTAVQQFEQAKANNPDIDFSNLTTLDELESYVEMVDLFTVNWPEEIEKNSKLQWHKTDDNSYWITLPSKEQISVQRDLLDKWNVNGLVNKNVVEQHGLISFQEALRVAESYINLFGRDMMTLIRRKSAWHKRPSSTSQHNLIKRLSKKVMPELLDRINFDTLSKGEAHTLIHKLTQLEFQ